jgi:hypothetical protein
LVSICIDYKDFRKEDFRVHVDGEGRLTVIGHRKPAPGAVGEGNKALRLHKAFQLPNTANLDAVSGRFDGTVLSLKVPKLQQEQQQQPAAAAPLPPPPPTAQAKEETRVADGGAKPAAAAHQEDKKTAPEKVKEEHEKAKSVAPPPPPQATEKKATPGDHRDDQQQDETAWAEHREKVAREAARRIEAARARVAEAKAKAERERQCEHWKDRAVEEGLKLADAVSKKKEVIATAVAAFTIGVFVSHKLFCRS